MDVEICDLIPVELGPCGPAKQGITGILAGTAEEVE